MTEITDLKAGRENHAGVVSGADMTLSLLALCLLGSFYTVLGVAIVRPSHQTELPELFALAGVLP